MKSNKLYSDSPKISKDKDGKSEVKKPSEATKQDIGASGNPLEGAGDGMPIPTHQAHIEHQEMLDRHAAEARDMHKRHGKEHDKLMEKHGVNKDEGKDGKTGEADKKKVEGTK